MLLVLWLNLRLDRSVGVVVVVVLSTVEQAVWVYLLEGVAEASVVFWPLQKSCLPVSRKLGGVEVTPFLRSMVSRVQKQDHRAPG